MNLDYFINYSISNVFCTVIFAIMLISDRMKADRQEKQLKYDHALIAFMLYFISDALWSAVDSNVIEANIYTAAITNFANYVFMAAITYTWLRYVHAVENKPNRNTRINIIAMLFPFVISTIALIITFFVSPHVLLDDNYKSTFASDAFLSGVPYIYIVATIIYSLRKAFREKNRDERRKHIIIGIFPLLVAVCGVLQLLFVPMVPIFEYSSTILMLMFYIQSMEKQISTDSLTGLNNRGQLVRFALSSGKLLVEGKSTFVVMIDINNFKAINDNYGHSEGDAALVLVADALVSAVKKNAEVSVFLGRYGGDEFVMVVNAAAESDVTALIDDVRKTVREECVKQGKKFVLSVSAGYEEYFGEQDSFTKCLQRADSKLYIDKEHCKLNGDTTVLK
ncbi:MAG: diguanylate cyclase [Clostridia bacterium]|nr:diguanylate cyclase [Clostridia bacterium]